jgi:hypothetical protein
MHLESGCTYTPPKLLDEMEGHCAEEEEGYKRCQLHVGIMAPGIGC